MHKSHLAKPHLTAEWILARMSSNERASEIIGDLLEQQKSPIAFYFAITRIMFAMSWRWMLAIPAAMISFMLEVKPYSHFVLEPYVRQMQQDMQRLHAHTSYGLVQVPLPMPMRIGVFLALGGMCLWGVASLALCLLGLRSTLTRLSWVLATLFTVASCAINLPHAWIVSPTALILVVGLLALYRPLRRPLLYIAATILSFAGVFSIFMILIDRVPIHHTAFLPFTLLGGYISCIIAEAWVVTRISRRLGTEPESPYA